MSRYLDRLNKLKSQNSENNQPTAVSKGRYQSNLDKLNDKHGNNPTVDNDFISKFFSDVSNYLKNAGSAYNGIGFSTAGNTYDTQTKAVKDLTSRAGAINNYLNNNRDSIGEESYKKLKNQLNDVGSALRSTHQSFYDAKKYYSQWKTEDDYNKAKDYSDMLRFDTEAGQKEIDDLWEFYDDAYSIGSWYAEYSTRGNNFEDENDKRNLAIYNELTQKYGDIYGLKKAIKEKEKYLAKAKETQGTYKASLEQATADKKRWEELSGGYDLTKAKEGKAGWEAYLAKLEEDKASEAEAQKSWDEKPWWEKAIYYLGDAGPDTSLPTIDTKTIAEGYRSQDAQLGVPDDRWSYEQQMTYGYLWQTNRPKATTYARAVNNMLNAQEEQEQIQKIQDWATKNVGTGALATAGAVLTAPLGLADWMGDLIASDAIGYIPENDGIVTPFELSQNVTSGISQHLNEKGTLDEDIPIIGGKGWGDVYGLGTSILQSSASAAAGGQVQTLLSFFGSAAASGVDDAVSRGATGDQALLYGTAVGLAEGLSEMVGIENLMKIGSSATVKELVSNLLKQGVAEGLEEGVSGFLGNVADNLIIGNKSNFYLRVNAYMNAGLSETEAKKKAWSELAEDIAFNMVGGFLSGAAHAGPKTTFHNVMVNNQQIAAGNAIMESDGGVEALKNLANEVAGVSDAEMRDNLTTQAEKISSEKATGNGLGKIGAFAKNTVNANRVGKLYGDVNTANNLANASANQADIAKSLMRDNFSTEDANAIADAIIANHNGQKLTSDQKKLIKSVRNNADVRDAVSNIIDNKQSTMGQRSQNIRNFTNDINLGRVAKATGISVDTLKQMPEGSTSTQEKKAVESHYDVSAEDKTIDNTTGNDIVITGVESIENGKMVLKTEDGTIDADKVSFATSDEALVYSVISDMDVSADTAWSLIKGFKATDGVSAQTYAIDLPLAYKYGKLNYKAGLKNLSITTDQGMTAFFRGRTDAEAEVKAKAAAVKSSDATISENSEQKEIIFEGFTYDEKTARPMQKASIAAIDVINKMSNLEVHIYQSVKKNGKYYAIVNGVERLAPNGYFTDGNKIYIDINAGNHGQGAMLYTLSHEVGHYIAQWNAEDFKAISDFLFEHYGENVPIDKLLDAQKQKLIKNYKADGKAIPSDSVLERMAQEELVCDMLSNMLADKNAYEKLMELKQKDLNLFQKLGEAIKKLLDKLKTLIGAYDNQSPDFQYAASMENFGESAFRELRDLYMRAFVQADANFQDSLAPGEEGTIVDENGDPVAHATENGTVQLSMRTYEEEGRDAFRKYLEKCVSSKKLTKAEMQEMMDGIEDIYNTCKEFKDKYAPFGNWSDAAVVRDTYGKPVFSVVTPNGEYKMNLDFSLVCKKRRTLDAVFNEMSKRGIIDNFELGQKSVVKINEIIRKYGFETACALCFADAKRFRQASMADSFTNLYNELVESLVPESKRDSIDRFNFAGYDTINKVENGIHTWDNSKLDFSHINHVLKTYGDGTVEYKAAKYIKSHAEGRKLLLRGDFMSSQGFDAVKSQNPDVLKLYNSKKGTGGPKAAFGDVQYLNEVIQKARWWTPAKAYAVGGVRVQSFSDYVPRMVFDYTQMIYDLAATKLPAHAYSKEALFVKQFGLTGVKINMSLIPAIAEGGIAPGLDADGNYVWAGESFDFETAKEIQDAEGYTENCGTICVGVSYEHIKKLLADPNIRQVIPYHKSGLNPIVAHMNRIAQFTDYTGSQNTLDKEGKKVEKDFDFSKALHNMGENADPKAVADQYLKWCVAKGYTPKFAEFAEMDGYYKLLEDFTLYDKDGNYVPQREVRAVFPTESSAFGSMKSLIEAGLQEDAVIEGKRDANLSAIVDEIQETLPKTEAEIAETEVEQADRDLEADTKLSDRDYSYDALVSKPDMVVATLGGNVPKNRADVVTMAKQNATSVGRFDPKTGSVSVHVADMDADVIIGRDGLKHSLDRRFDMNAPVVLKAGEILGNSIRINELTPQKAEAAESYVLIGAAKNDSGDLYIVRSVVNRFSNELTSMDVLYAINAKKESAALLPLSTGKPALGTDSTISIASLLDYVNEYFPDILPEDVLKHYGHEARPDGKLGKDALYSDRDYVAYDRTAILKESKVDEYLNDYAAKSSPKYAQAYIAYMRPSTFLKLTTDDWMERDIISEQAGELDEKRLSNSRPGIYLRIDHKTGEVTGHEGRHRMSAMDKAGIYYVPVLLLDTSNKMSKTDIDEITLHGQFDESAVGIVNDAIPLSYENRNRVIEKFATQSSRQRAGESIGYNKTLRFQDRDTDSVSNRSLLANAFEGVAQNDIEKQKVQEYKDKIDLIDAEEQKLGELNEKIKELSFSKGPRDTKAIRDLQFEARQTANRISTYDKQLLRLEASKPLQDVLTREKKLAYKRAEQKGKEALADYKEKAAEAQRALREKWQESRKKGIDSRHRTAMRHQIKDVVNELNQYLLRGTKDRHVPIELQKAVAEALDAVNMDTVGAEERIAKLQAELMKAKTPEQIQEVSRKIDHIQEMGDKMNGKLKKLKDAYDQFVNSDDPLIANSHDEVISNKLQSVIESIGNTPLRDMTLTQLEDVYDMYRMVLTTIRNANKAFKAKKSESISVIANQVMMEVEKVGGKKKLSRKGIEEIKSFAWNNLKPVYAFEHIGSDSFTEVFNNVRAGEDVWAVDVTEAREYYLDKSKKHNYDSWDFKKRFNFKSASGMDFSLNLEQIMSLYAYSKRDQAADHLKKGGIVIDETTEITIKNKLGIPVKFNPTEATAYNISDETLADIISKLSDEQKSFVDEMQDYLSSVMGAKGNEVSLEMYGVKLFKEKFYFPLKSAQQFMAKAKEQQNGEVKIKNSGFSKETVQKASNPIVLTPFMQVWSNHVNEMSMYHAFVLPMEDFYRVYNYKTPTSETMATESVEMFIQNAYGKGATKYIDQLLKDLNGGARTDSTTGVINKMMGLFKKGAVFASLSVVVQQPSAMARAIALVDTKYFIGPKVDHKRHKALWEEVKQYAPVAIIKEMGYFDTNMGKSTQDFILSKDYSSFSEKMKALVTDSGYRDEVLSKAPALADELAWCSIWEAVKRETKAKNPGMDTKSEAFLKKAGERFTEVITKTQVYDSVLSRSGMMRSKDTGMKMATAFMAEPTTSINMITDALLQGKRGNKKYARKAIGAVIAAQILNSILVSFVYAGRDDDEDETYVEKYIGTFTAEVIDGLNPATYIPFIKDIVSIAQGYDVERSDMAVISDLWKAWENLSKDNVSIYRKVEGFAGSVAQIFGLPVKNIMRDVRGIYQTIDSFVNGQQTTGAGVGYAVKSALPKWIGGGDVSNQNQLYEAYLSGDEAHLVRVLNRYADEDAANKAMRSAIKERFEAGEIDFDTALQYLIEYGGMDEDKAFWKVEEWGYEGSSDEDFSKYNEFYEAVQTGKDLKTVIQKYTDNGVSTDTLASQITSHFKDIYIGMSISEKSSIKGYLLNAMVILGDPRADAEDKIGEWEFEGKWGFAYSDRAEAYKSGKISSSQLKTVLVNVGGKTAEEADLQVQVYDWEKQGYDEATIAAVREYNEHCSAYNVPKDVYLYIRKFANNTNNDVDANGKTIYYSAMRKIMAEIDEQYGLTSYQKTAIARSLGWADKNINKYKAW